MQILPDTSIVHPGWVRATAILMRGLERLESAEREHAQTTKHTHK